MEDVVPGRQRLRLMEADAAHARATAHNVTAM